MGCFALTGVGHHDISLCSPSHKRGYADSYDASLNDMESSCIDSYLRRLLDSSREVQTAVESTQVGGTLTAPLILSSVERTRWDGTQFPPHQELPVQKTERLLIWANQVLKLSARLSISSG